MVAVSPIRLLVADDHPVVRAGLRAVLESEPDIAVVDDVATAEAAVERARAGDVDVVLKDLQFVLTTYDTEADIIAAVEAGASGYLLKDAPPDELIAAVRAAAAGQSALAPAVTGRLMDRMRAPEASLSPREAEVLTLVADGLSTVERADRSTPVRVPGNGQVPPRAHLRQARRRLPHGCRRHRGAPRTHPPGRPPRIVPARPPPRTPASALEADR
jgi:CheY-like chemotaxis protein